MRPLKRRRADPPAEKRQAAEGPQAVVKPDEKPGVLVVDDDHVVRIMVQMGLERNGFDVWSASSGREAIHLYRKHRDHIDVVLLDVRMTGLDGLQTLDALRELNPRVQACFITGDTGLDKLEELWRRGAARVIAKPFHLDELANILRPLARGTAAELPPPGTD